MPKSHQFWFTYTWTYKFSFVICCWCPFVRLEQFCKKSYSFVTLNKRPLFLDVNELFRQNQSEVFSEKLTLHGTPFFSLTRFISLLLAIVIPHSQLSRINTLKRNRKKRNFKMLFCNSSQTFSHKPFSITSVCLCFDVIRTEIFIQSLISTEFGFVFVLIQEL